MMSGIDWMQRWLFPLQSMVQAAPLTLPVRHRVHNSRTARSEAEESNTQYLRCLHLSEALSFGMLVTDTDGDPVYSNAAYQKLTGRSAKALRGCHWTRLVHPADRTDVIGQWQESMEKQMPFVADARLTHAGGEVIWVRLNIVALNDCPPVGGYLHTIENINTTKRKDLERQAKERLLTEEQVRTRVMLDAIGDAVISTDVQGHVTDMNIMAENMTGWPRELALGQPLTQVFNIVDATTRQPVENPAQRAIAKNQRVDLAMNTVLLGRHGVELAIENSATLIHDGSGAVTGAVVVFHDVKFSHAKAQKMAHMALHDNLTGLPNRAALAERLTQALALARRHHKQVGLLFIDLDNFKQVNDAFGHASGDQLLVALAARLQESVRSTDTVCRYGGDEFVVLLSEIEQREDAVTMARKLHKVAAHPHRLNGGEIELTLSIGISVFPEDGENMQALLHKADTAMYLEKVADN